MVVFTFSVKRSLYFFSFAILATFLSISDLYAMEPFPQILADISGDVSNIIKSAAKTGSKPAQNKIIENFSYGLYKKRFSPEAIRFTLWADLQKRCLEDDRYAYYYYYHQNALEEFPDLVKNTRERAEGGEPGAQRNLGYLCTPGHGFEEGSFQTACEWYEKAHQQGDPWASYKIAKLYLNGHMGDLTKEEKHEKALEYLKNPCAKGLPKALSLFAKLHVPEENLGDYFLCYVLKRQRERKERKQEKGRTPAQGYLLDQEKGRTPAQDYLLDQEEKIGSLHFTFVDEGRIDSLYPTLDQQKVKDSYPGYVLDPAKKEDYEKAYQAYLSAAKQGCRESQFCVAHMLLWHDVNGGISEKNDQEAEKWFEKARKQHQEDAVNICKEVDKLCSKENPTYCLEHGMKGEAASWRSTIIPSVGRKNKVKILARHPTL